MMIAKMPSATASFVTPCLYTAYDEETDRQTDIMKAYCLSLFLWGLSIKWNQPIS